MTNGRPKKRGRPRKIKPIPVGDYAPKRVRPDSPDFFEKMMEFVRWLVIRVVIATIIGLVAFFAIIASVEEPAIISPLGSEPGMPRGYRLIPISHPEVAHAEEIKEQPQTPKTDIERLVLETFGVNQYDTAMCIIKHESGANPTRENLGKARVGYRGECSIGLFQINLASNGCAGKHVHWNKAQGNTLSEKIAWLKVPENNVKIAKQLFDASGWNPWTTYKKCK